MLSWSLTFLIVSLIAAVETGRQNGLKVGDRAVVPFAIACGQCYFCHNQLYSLCDNSNPNGELVSIPEVYGGIIDKFNFGAAFGKGLTLKMGQTHVHKYMPRLLQLIEEQKIDPSFIITHRLSLDDASQAYRIFHENRDSCLKVVLRPHNGQG